MYLDFFVLCGALDGVPSGLADEVEDLGSVDSVVETGCAYDFFGH